VLPEAYHTKLFYNDASAAEPSCLSMFIGPGSFMYALSGNEFSNISELCHVVQEQTRTGSSSLSDHVNFFLNNHQLPERKITQVNISVLNSEFTLVPEAYADDQSFQPLLQFATGSKQLKSRLSHHIKNIRFCFGLPADLASTLERAFPAASIRHAGAVSIGLFFSHHSLTDHQLFLQIGEGVIELAAKNKNELLFYNVFAVETNEDVLYYLLFMMEQFALDPASVSLAVAGERPVSDPLIKSIRKYISHVGFCVSDPSIRLKGELLSLPQHYYFTLLNQHLCVL
jgi:hypothetical protein